MIKKLRHQVITFTEEQETLTKLRELHSEVDLAYDLVQQFAQMLRTRTGEHLDAWLDQVANSKLASMSFDLIPFAF